MANSDLLLERYVRQRDLLLNDYKVIMSENPIIKPIDIINQIEDYNKAIEELRNKN